MERGHDAPRMMVEVVDSELDAGRYSAFVEDPGCGAIVTFAGVTRDTFEGRRVVRLEYEAYAPMVGNEVPLNSHSAGGVCWLTRLRKRLLFIRQAVSELRKISQHVIDAYGATKVAIAHRTGVCPVGHASVIIVVSSAHRRAAIEGMSYAIDELKVRRSRSELDRTWEEKFSRHVRDNRRRSRFYFPLQATVPIWKKEFYEDGSVWKENAEDRERRRREKEQS